MSKDLKDQVLNDVRLDRVLDMARSVVSTGLTAGDYYQEVWIRDVNTFIEYGLSLPAAAEYQKALGTLLLLQGPEGDVPDGYVDAAARREPPYRTSAALAGLVAHKNTVETDQESSLVQAVALYVRLTGDRAFLDELVEGRAVRDRLGDALEYVRSHRWSSNHGLAWSGTKADWGDVQPEDVPGTHFNANSHRAIGIYDNALFAIAMASYADLLPESDGRALWRQRYADIVADIRHHLWDAERYAFLPHLYLEEGSPFPADFDERAIVYHGGTAVAIEAGVLTPVEIQGALRMMRANVAAAGAGTIGLTLHPAYPAGLFANEILTQPYTYQNGGDWDWFGGRLVRQLIAFGFVEDAVRELSPMLDRILRVGDFPEWWTLDSEPRGSKTYRGSAGVIAMAILDLRRWAEAA